MSILLYLQIGFFFSLFIKLINDFLPEPKDMKGINLNVSKDYSGWQLIFLSFFWPIYIVLFLLLLIRNRIEIGNKKK